MVRVVLNLRRGFGDRRVIPDLPKLFQLLGLVMLLHLRDQIQILHTEILEPLGYLRLASIQIPRQIFDHHRMFQVLMYLIEKFLSIRRVNRRIKEKFLRQIDRNLIHYSTSKKKYAN
jgi:hypothetical protein